MVSGARTGRTNPHRIHSGRASMQKQIYLCAADCIHVHSIMWRNASMNHGKWSLDKNSFVEGSWFLLLWGPKWKSLTSPMPVDPFAATLAFGTFFLWQIVHDPSPHRTMMIFFYCKRAKKLNPHQFGLLCEGLATVTAFGGRVKLTMGLNFSE